MDNSAQLPKIQYGPIPQVNLEPKIDEQEKKLKLLEKIIQIDISLNIIVFGFLLLIALFMFFLRFDLLDYFAKKYPNNTNNQAVLAPSPKGETLIEKNKPEQNPSDVESIYINQQGINIDNLFKLPGDNITLTIHGKFKKQVLGFLPYWMVPKIDEIDIKPYTAISYFGLEVDGDGNIIKNDSKNKVISVWSQFQSDPNFEKFLKKAKQERIKVYLTLKCFNHDNMAKLLVSENSRQNFITNALFLMNSKSLDGINLDFEYIGTPDKKVIDGFSSLVIQLNKELKRQYPKSVLTIDTFVDAASRTRIHDVEILSANSDALVVMAYDFHTPKSAYAGPVAPMEGYGNSLKGLINSYLEKVPAEKIIIAVPFYGYDWPTEDGNQNSKTLGSSPDVRILPYGEVSDASKDIKIGWDEKSQTPWYSYKDRKNGQTRVVHFENTRSLGIKFDYILSKNLQGAGVWAMGFTGKKNDLNQLLIDKFVD